MIPKIIHYCWFGRNPLSARMKKCIESWKKNCPDYKIIEWNEDNFNIQLNGYTKMCYEQKKYAFLSDYARLWIVYQNGGIYLDTDVEVLKSFDKLLNIEAFFGFENCEYVNTGLGFGAVKKNGLVKAMLEEYKPYTDGKHGTAGCPILHTEALCKVGLKQNGKLQYINEAAISPKEYFNPCESTTGKLLKTENTYSIHWYSMSWLAPEQRLKSRITKIFHRLLGTGCFQFLKGGEKNK